MDNVTHTLFGVTLARAGLQRVCPHATLLLILSANIPDIDIVALAGGSLAYLEAHRGYTHTFLALPVLALACVGLTALLTRTRLPLWRAWGVACAGVASHLLLDWTNSYGVRPFLPFSSRWFYLDLNGLYDLVMLAAMFLALALPWFVGLVGSEIGVPKKRTGQGSAITVLLFLILFDYARWTLHENALNELNSRMYTGEQPVNVAALPDPVNPWQWTGVVETQDAFRLVRTDALSFNNGSDSLIFSKPPQSAAYGAAKATEPFRYLSYFSRFPVWGFEPIELNSRVAKRADLTDLRFGTPGRGGFHAIAEIDAAGHVAMSEFTFGSGPHLGWGDKH
jgi:inner membrane protein